MYLLLTILPLFFSFNSQIHTIPVERHVSKIVAGQNSVIIVFPHSFGLYSAITDSIEYYPLKNKIENCINIEGTDTYILFGANNIILMNRFLYQFNDISTSGHQFVNYRKGRDIFLQDISGKTFLLNMSGLFEEDTTFSDWKSIKTNSDITQFPQLSPYFISKGNNIYRYTSVAKFRDKIFAGTDNFGFFIIDKYSGEKVHILNGILGSIKGVKTINNEIVIFSDRDIAILQNRHFTFFLDTLFFYPHFQDNIGDVEIKNDTVYFSGKYSIYYISNEGIYKFVSSSFTINDFKFAGKKLFYATDNGVTIIRGKKHRTVLSGITVYDIFKSDRILFFATENGIYFMNGDKVGRINQFSDISYREVDANDIAIGAVSFSKTVHFLNLQTDSLVTGSANTNLFKGNICSLDSNFLYISGGLIREFPGNRIFRMPQSDNTPPLNLKIVQGTVYFFLPNALLFMPVNNIFPFFPHR